MTEPTSTDADDAVRFPGLDKIGKQSAEYDRRLTELTGPFGQLIARQLGLGLPEAPCAYCDPTTWGELSQADAEQWLDGAIDHALEVTQGSGHDALSAAEAVGHGIATAIGVTNAVAASARREGLDDIPHPRLEAQVRTTNHSRTGRYEDIITLWVAAGQLEADCPVPRWSPFTHVGDDDNPSAALIIRTARNAHIDNLRLWALPADQRRAEIAESRKLALTPVPDTFRGDVPDRPSPV